MTFWECWYVAERVGEWRGGCKRTLSGTKTWLARLAGAHDALSEVSSYDTFVYQVQARNRLRVLASPNQNSRAHGTNFVIIALSKRPKYKEAYVHRTIVIGRVVGVHRGAEDAWDGR